jgi:hypothetical protein
MLLFIGGSSDRSMPYLQEAKAHHASATTSDIDPPVKISQSHHHGHIGPEGEPRGASAQSLKHDQEQNKS